MSIPMGWRPPPGTEPPETGTDPVKMYSCLVQPSGSPQGTRMIALRRIHAARGPIQASPEARAFPAPSWGSGEGLRFCRFVPFIASIQQQLCKGWPCIVVYSYTQAIFAVKHFRSGPKRPDPARGASLGLTEQGKTRDSTTDVDTVFKRTGAWAGRCAETRPQPDTGHARESFVRIVHYADPRTGRNRRGRMVPSGKRPRK